VRRHSPSVSPRRRKLNAALTKNNSTTPENVPISKNVKFRISATSSRYRATHARSHALGADAGLPAAKRRPTHRQGDKARRGRSTKLIAYLRHLGRHASHFGSAHGGATAVEFAMIAPALLGVIIAILEVMYFLFAQQTLQTAATEAGRMFMTNQGPAQNQMVDNQGRLLST